MAAQRTPTPRPAAAKTLPQTPRGSSARCSSSGRRYATWTPRSWAHRRQRTAPRGCPVDSPHDRSAFTNAVTYIVAVAVLDRFLDPDDELALRSFAEANAA